MAALTLDKREDKTQRQQWAFVHGQMYRRVYHVAAGDVSAIVPARGTAMIGWGGAALLAPRVKHVQFGKWGDDAKQEIIITYIAPEAFA